MSRATPVPVTRIDLMCKKLAADPWPTLSTLREQGPILWHEVHQRWLVTSDREARQVLLDYERFTVQGTVVEDLFGADAFISVDDRSRHNTLRDIWANAFRPQALKALRKNIATILDQLLDPVADKLRACEAVDLSDTLCRPLPTLVIALMMGVPEERLADVVRWSDAMAGGGPAYLDDAVREAAIRARDEAKTSLADFLKELIVLRRQQPTDDLIGAMVKADVAQSLSDDALVQNLRQLLFAGNETTARWLSHIFLTYGEQRDVQREISANRTLITAANEEVMRWQGVVGTLPRRVCGGPIEIAGVELTDGDHITCLTGCANRDPERFEAPDQFNIHRTPQPHLGFGIGLHNCLGAALARLEVEMAVNALLDRVHDFHIAAPYHYTAIPVRGPLPVTIALDNS